MAQQDGSVAVQVVMMRKESMLAQGQAFRNDLRLIEGSMAHPEEQLRGGTRDLLMNESRAPYFLCRLNTFPYSFLLHPCAFCQKERNLCGAAAGKAGVGAVDTPHYVKCMTGRGGSNMATASGIGCGRVAALPHKNVAGYGVARSDGSPHAAVHGFA